MKSLIAKALHVTEVRLNTKCDILTLDAKRDFTRPWAGVGLAVGARVALPPWQWRTPRYWEDSKPSPYRPSESALPYLQLNLSIKPPVA